MNQEKDLADTALLAAELTATLEEHGTDAMFQKLEDSLRHSGRWHSLFDVQLLRARASLKLPLAGPLTNTDATAKKTLDEKQLPHVVTLAGNSLMKDRLLPDGCIYERLLKPVRSWKDLVT